MVKTSLCIFRKLEIGESPDPTSNTLLLQVDNLGYDATGRMKRGSEVQEVIELFHKEIGWK